MSERHETHGAKGPGPAIPTTPPTMVGKGLFPQGFALLIGVGRCDYEPWSLPVTSKDAESLRDVLADTEHCGYLSENIQLLTDEDASRKDILDALEVLDRKAAHQPNSTVIVYYSGHGWIDEEGHYYLVPRDTKPFDLASTALGAEEFTKALTKIRPERLLVILDTCHAAGMAEAKDVIPPGFHRKAPPEDFAEILGSGQGRAVLSSCRGEQKSWILPDNSLSVFTHHLIEGFRGQGSPSGATFVSVLDLMNHVSREVRSTAKAQGKVQSPYHKMEAESFAVAMLLSGIRPKNPPVPSNELTEKSGQGLNKVVMGDEIGTRAIIHGDLNNRTRTSGKS